MYHGKTWRMTVLAFSSLALMAILGGCQAFLPLGGSTTDSDQGAALKSEALGAGRIGTIDDLFAEVARRVPAFGGIFSDDQGKLTIYLTDPREKASVEAAIVAVLSPQFPDIAELVQNQGTQLLQGKYSFAQLKEWKDGLLNLHSIPGVVFTDIDDANNRLTVGVEQTEVTSQVQKELSVLGISLEAVNFEVTGPIDFATHTLRSQVRPTVGGLQIAYTTTSGLHVCTLGFNATRSGVSGFVTNSHCSAVIGQVNSTSYGQPSTSYGIGFETVDPSLFTGGACPANRQCRYSDAIFAQYSSGVSSSKGYIARTTGLGSVTINHNSPTFRITDGASPSVTGPILNKVGTATGWTQGAITLVCADVALSGTSVTWLCQSRVRANVDQGDSGSPVFRITNSPNSGDVTLYGILWGIQYPFWPWDPREFWFSPDSAVYIELGRPTYCASGFFC